FAIRRSFQQKIMLIQAHEKLVVSNTQALTDGLTGIWNRFGFEELQIIFMDHARKKNCPFSIILGDVDGLKQYNDKYGHPQADLALKAITQIISAQIRTTDSLARYGGDEFAIFCFDLDQHGAESLIGRITNALKDAPLSMSFGTAAFPVDGLDSKELIQLADSRLYQAKAINQPSLISEHDSDCQCENCKCNDI
ncbi:MAG: GGDEF domain-containing protein, partial [Anaerolineaceae bacterium]